MGENLSSSGNSPVTRGALALAQAFDNESQELFRQTGEFGTAEMTTAEIPGTAQPTLFSGPPSNLIPFENIQRRNTAPPKPAPKTSAKLPPPAIVKNPTIETQSFSTGSFSFQTPPTQTRMEFVPVATPKPKTLENDVRAAVSCDFQVASCFHRFVAASIDTGLILLGFGICVTLALGIGGDFGGGNMFAIVLAVMFVAIALFYGAIWVLMGTETIGMQLSDLELITLDGFPVDGKRRMLRYMATLLSFCSGGLGVLWSLVDEEKLAWHDHISESFPTVRETPTSFVRQRR